MSHIPYCTPPYHSVPYHTLALSHFTSPHLTSSHPSPTLPYPSLPHPTLPYATDPTVPNPTLSFISIPIQPQSSHPKLTLPYSTRHKHSLTYPTEIKLYGNVKVTRYTFIDTHYVTIDRWCILCTMSIVINSHLITSVGGKHGGLPTFMIDSIFL